jgi:hypothetical protein
MHVHNFEFVNKTLPTVDWILAKIQIYKYLHNLPNECNPTHLENKVALLDLIKQKQKTKFDRLGKKRYRMYGALFRIRKPEKL